MRTNRWTGVSDATRIAAAHFQGRLEEIKDRILELPPSQRLILAAEMLEEPGISRDMPQAILRQVLSELERDEVRR